MPPKAGSSVRPPCRSTRNTARKSTPPPPHPVATPTSSSSPDSDQKTLPVLLVSENSMKTLASSSSSIVMKSDDVVGCINFDDNAVEKSGETTGSGKVKRKIIKKTVRMVKKVIKRRVPKRDFNGAIATEVTDSHKPAEFVTQHSNLANNATEKHSILNEASEKSNLVGEVKGVLSLDCSASVDGKCCNISGVDAVEMETSKSKLGCDASVLEPKIDNVVNDITGIDCTESKTSTICVPEPMICEIGNDQNGVYSVEMDNTNSDDVMTEVERKDLNMHTPDSTTVDLMNYAAITTVLTAGTVAVEDSAMEKFLEDSDIENQIMDVVNEGSVVTGQDADPVEAKNVVLVQDENDNVEKSGSSNDSHIVSRNDLLFSGEMEALERRKQRRTEIFVRGLDKQTKEEDIRKVFEEVGAILEVRVVMNIITGKNRGFAFLRFATAADAKNALAKYSKVEICGKQCSTAAVEGNDTIFLGNIDRKWKTEDVMQLLNKAGIKKIDTVTVKADPGNIKRNRGFAFVELETSRHAQHAFDTLQKNNVFGNQVKVAWAQPLKEPAEEEILKVKSVYAEYLPSSWDEGEVREYFERFGQIESVVLAKDLSSSKRNDFAFIKYANRDAALACIDTISRERSEEDSSKVKIAVSLAKPSSRSKQMKQGSDPTNKQLSNEKPKVSQGKTSSRSKQMKQGSDPTNKQLSKEKPKVSQANIKLHEPRTSWEPASSTYHHVKVDTRSSTTDELVQLLRQQASSSQIPVYPGPTMRDKHFPLPGSKRPFPLVGHDLLYSEPRGLVRPRLESFYPVPEPRVLLRPHMESSYPVSGPSTLSHSLRTSAVSYNQQEPHFAFEFLDPVHRRNYPSHFQVGEQAPYHGNNNVYRRY